MEIIERDEIQTSDHDRIMQKLGRLLGIMFILLLITAFSYFSFVQIHLLKETAGYSQIYCNKKPQPNRWDFCLLRAHRAIPQWIVCGKQSYGGTTPPTKLQSRSKPTTTEGDIQLEHRESVTLCKSPNLTRYKSRSKKEADLMTKQEAVSYSQAFGVTYRF